MLAVVVEGLVDAGHKVTTSVSVELNAEVVERWRCLGVDVVVDANPCGSVDSEMQSVMAQWKSVAGATECAVLIAPEIDGVLETAIERVGKQTRLINCRNPMLSVASDKWKTAMALSAARIPHPPTRLLSDYGTSSVPNTLGLSSMIAKRRDGAGCDSTRVFDSAEGLMAFKRQCHDPTRWIVQPFLDGESFSISCFAGPTGIAWMKPVRQSVVAVSRSATAGSAGLEYRGATVDIERLEHSAARHWAAKTISALGDGALGWMGVDLLHDIGRGQWQVIEVNPRCTSSVLELSRAHDKNLPGNMCLLGQLWGHGILGQRIAPKGVVTDAISF